ncbi:MAG: protein TolQ [Gammaproteobacteria bacterium]|nr:protein TolQ [Gammaproteobacteria bacterium]
METDLSYIALIMEASLVVQIVMVVLLLASLASWVVIFEKRKTVRQARAATDEFERSFWSGGDLNELFQRVSANKRAMPGMAAIFEGGFTEFKRLNEDLDLEPGPVIEGTRRAMRVAQMREMDRLEQNLAFLATVGSTSPYVGLFGTVFGIMNAFRGLANVQQATLAMVAPGIAEALIATAMGLFAAIPAVIAYNRYADHVDRIESRFDSFIEEFSTIVQRHARARRRKERA